MHILEMKERTAVIRMDLNVNDRAHTNLSKYEHLSSRYLQKSTSGILRHVRENSRKYNKSAENTSKKIRDKENIQNDNANAEEHYEIFRKCTMCILIWGQVLGLCPVVGLLEKDPNKLRFTIYSWRFLYTMFICTIQVTSASANLVSVILEVSPMKCSVFVLYTCYCLSTILFLRAATKWPLLAKEVASSGLSVGPTMKVKFLSTFFITLSMGLFEYFLFATSVYSTALDCSPDKLLQTYIEFNFRHFFELGLQYNMALGIVLKYISVICYVSWSYSDLFVICMSIYFKELLDELCIKIRYAKNKDVSPCYWKNLRKQYTASTRLVHLFDDIVNVTIFLSFASTLLFICIQIFQVFRNGFVTHFNDECPYYPSGLFRGYEHGIYFVYSSLYLLSRSIMLALFASSVYTASLNIAPALYEVPSSASNEISRFIEQVHGNTVTLTGCRFFNMTRSVILSVAGTIVTYEFVLLQFNGRSVS